MFNSELINWLESLGMITNDNRPKPAWTAFLEEIQLFRRRAAVK